MVAEVPLSWCLAVLWRLGWGGPRTRDLDPVTRVDLKVRRLEATVSSVPVFTDMCVEGSPPRAQTLLFVCVWGAPLPAPVSCSF